MKRTTLHIFEKGEFAEAHSLVRFLKHQGVDASLVTKHAVQVHPEHAVKAAEVLPKYKWGWDRQEEDARED